MQVSRTEQLVVTERFLAALRTGRLQELMDVMAPDVVLIADGGGLAAVLSRASRFEFASAIVWLNGAPAGRIEVAGEPTTISLAVHDGRVTQVYLVRNPRKLTRLDKPAILTR